MYGPHDIEGKRRVWGELLEVMSNSTAPIVIFGDFNEIRKIEEHKGCSSLTRSLIEFDEWINNFELFDTPITGRKFTWRRGRSCSRPDRILINPSWLDLFPSLGLNYSISNHIPLPLDSIVVDWGPKPFRSRDAWFTHPGFIKIVETEWWKLEGNDVSCKL